MKIMDDSIKDSDCSVEMVTPIRKKKLKQARLPFQLLSTADSPNSVSKKRKLTSPSVEYKTPKMVKIAKENSAKNIPILDIEAIDEHNSNESTNAADKSNNEDCQILDTSIEKITPKKNTGKRRTDDKSGMSGALTKFLKKAQATKDETEKEEKEKDLKKESQSRLPKEKADLREAVETPKKSREEEEEDNDDEEDTEEEDEDEEDEETPSTPVQDTSQNTVADSDADVTAISSENEANDEEITCVLSETLTVGHPNKKPKKLTPKQLVKQLEIAKKREERVKLKMEKEKQREEERKIKRKEREQKRKEKEERDQAEKEQKKKERELKELKKQMENEQKQKEKEAKEEERRKKEEAKEEEKKKKEEEKMELERKKQKAASNFASFFVAKKQEAKSTEDEGDLEVRNFMPFEVKADMRIAPLTRRTLSKEEKVSLTEKCKTGGVAKSQLYIGEIRNKKIVPRQSKKTWPRETKDDIVILDEENDDSNVVEETEPVAKHRAKFLQFAENRRPPYWGTWRKVSNFIKARRPFSTDSKWFDYDVDSDEEWEEEEPGESLHGSDDEKDEENAEDNEYDVDNEFMVPHGYLSDEEARADEEEKEDMTPETQKYKLKLLGEEFEAEMNAKTSRLKPKIIGCIWQGPDNEFPESVPAKVVEYLSARKAWVHQIPVILNNAPSNEAGSTNSPTLHQGRPRMTKLSEEALPDLIRLVHGNTHGRSFLVKEFMTFLSKKNPGGQQHSKAGLGKKIREIGRWMACPEEGPMHLKACWYVSEDTRNQYLTEPLSLPNSWSYNLTPRRKSDVAESAEKSEKDDKEKAKEKEKKNVPLITQFTKKIMPEELMKQMAPKSSQSTVQSPDQSVNRPVSQSTNQSTKQSTKSSVSQIVKQKTPKRAQLISVPRDGQLSKSSGESLLSKFINKMTKVKVRVDDDGDDIIVLKDIENETKVEVDGRNVKEKKSQKDKKVTFNVGGATKETGSTNSKLQAEKNICKEVRIVLTPVQVDK